MKLKLFILLLSLLLPVARAQASSMFLRQTSFDGGLYLAFPITGFWLGDDLQITIAVSHETKYNSFEDSICSSWGIDGLTTYLVCNEKNQLAWRSPTGDTAHFDKALLAKQKNLVNNGCMLLVMGEDEYVVADARSRKWFYKRGSLEKVQYQQDGKVEEMSFKCSNGMIREMSYKNHVTLSVRQQGSLLLFFVKDQQIAAIQYDETGRFIDYINFADERRPALKFTYEENNLVQLDAGVMGGASFVWKEVGLWQKWFGLLQYPVYLYSDGHYTYTHGFYFGRARITATDSTGKREMKTLNLKSGLITDKKSPAKPIP